MKERNIFESKPTQFPWCKGNDVPVVIYTNSYSFGIPGTVTAIDPNEIRGGEIMGPGLFLYSPYVTPYGIEILESHNLHRVITTCTPKPIDVVKFVKQSIGPAM